MANQIITNCCNANCPYCFAADARSRDLQEGRKFMSGEEVREWLDFTLRAGIKELRLLGGEPTLHPQFPEFVRLGVEKGCTIMVFSNGVMPDPAAEALAALDPEICSVVINMNAAIRQEDRNRWRDTLAKLGPRITLGITLTSTGFFLPHLAAPIQTFGTKKKIRIGLSNPTWMGTNLTLHPKRYPAVAQKIYEQSFVTARYGITLDADCGFVRCMFGDNFERLKENGFNYISRCAPVLDLCMGGKILPCFGLSNLTAVSRDDVPDAQAVYEHLSERLKPWHSFGIYPECTDCPLFETEECSGGCLAARLRRLQPMTEGAE